MTSLVLPTDNAVIDYSIIAQIVAAINDIQAQVIANKPQTSKDPATGQPVVLKVVAKTFAQGEVVSNNHIPFPAASNTSQITINAADLGLVSITSITANIYTGSSPRYIWLSTFNSGQAVFSINQSVSSGCKISIIAAGT